MSNLISAAVQRRRVGAPSRKSVLLYMADKAADDGTGIWTSKANIALDLELSVRTVQYAIQDMIQSGLLRETGQRDCRFGFTFEYAIMPEAVDNLPSTREPPVDKSPATPAAGAPGATIAPLPGATSAPHPVQPVHPNHPKNHTTTPRGATEAVDNSAAQDACLKAAGPGLCPASRSEITGTAEIISGWLQAGIDLERVVLPVISQRTQSVRASPIRTWAYFDSAVRRAHHDRAAQAARSGSAEKGIDRAASAAENPPAPGRDDQLRFFADWILSDRYLPANATTNTMARALLRRAMVSADDLRRRGVPIPAPEA